jgi:hypothetical protein
MLEDINNVKKDIQEYIETRIDLVRLHTAENLSRIFSSAVNTLIIGYLLLLILLFLSLSAGYLFASLLNSNSLGFLCVAGFYIIALVIYLIIKKNIVERPVIRSIMRLFFPKFRDDER